MSRFLQKAAKRILREVGMSPSRLRDAITPTYATNHGLSSPRMATYLTGPSLDTLRSYAAELRFLTEHFTAHRFNLLGSDWVSLDRGEPSRGLEGSRYAPRVPSPADRDGNWLQTEVNLANSAFSREAWRCVSASYRPIDWQRDFKSGFRWSARTWHGDIRYGTARGADIKVPWELARMQHLVTLSWGYGLALHGEEGFQSAARYAREIQDQILDFIATNPPRYGVNWQCPMDVAIRATNWLVAYDLLRACGAPLEVNFEHHLLLSLLDHGRFLYSHLEWAPSFTGNHYLANIAGLCFIGAYLPADVETDAWLAFGIQELLRETAHQFAPDGSNFEASTCYHALSAEMVTYATMIVSALSPERLAGLQHYRPLQPKRGPRLAPPPVTLYDGCALPPAHFEHLARIASFLADATGPDGRLLQFGDNDSGHFLRPHPHLEAPFEAPQERLEGMRDSRPLLQTLRRFLSVETPDDGWVGLGLHQWPERSAHVIGTDRSFAHYPNFGLVIYRTSGVYLAMRCGDVGQDGRGGHAHNDALSFELALNGFPVILDPGTYLYTPLPERRNAFRATRAHNTLFLETGEQNPIDPRSQGLFLLPERAHAKMQHVAANHVVGEHRGFGAPHRRTLHVLADGIEGFDEYPPAGVRYLRFLLAPQWRVSSDGTDGDLLLMNAHRKVRFSLEGGSAVIETSSYSPAYGIIIETHAIRVTSESPSIRWTLRWL